LTTPSRYRAELGRVQDPIKSMVKRDGGAISATSTWQVNGSVVQAKGDTEGVERLQAHLADVVGEIGAVDFRARTLAAGHAFVQNLQRGR